MRNLTALFAGTALLSGFMIGTSFASAPNDFKLVTKIPLPTKAGHGDWVAFDPATHDIYVSLKDSGMAVIDTKSNKVVHDLKDIAAPNTMTFDKDYIYETAAEGAGKGKVNQVVVIDKHDWKIVDRVATKGTSPDGTFIDASKHRLFVVSDDNNWIEVYTTGAHPKRLATYDLKPAKPEAGPDVADLVNGVIYATDDSDVETVNPQDGRIGIVADYHLKLGKTGGTKDMFWDPDHHAIWVATTNHVLYVVDPKTLEILRPLPETAGADEAAYDPGLGLAYVFESGIPGFDVYSVKDEKYLTTVDVGVKGPTHSGTVDPINHDVYAYVGGDASLYVYRPEVQTVNK